ncbi:hypothetical protein DFH08DRAFT_1047737 [Mycena albidolilacea]|uniref:Uncharacterized protein n=1 Tax=Mycena albidolilacea TaxID=1033008 RepID=A0AAD7AEP5_9AGAR|nr:hypothetical protein DFH08DRAFT_1047737 [Mycena albidolilacea]
MAGSKREASDSSMPPSSAAHQADMARLAAEYEIIVARLTGQLDLAKAALRQEEEINTRLKEENTRLIKHIDVLVDVFAGSIHEILRDSMRCFTPLQPAPTAGPKLEIIAQGDPPLCWAPRGSTAVFVSGPPVSPIEGMLSPALVLHGRLAPHYWEPGRSAAAAVPIPIIPPPAAVSTVARV